MDAGTTRGGPGILGPGPPNLRGRSRLDELEAWIEDNAAQARRALLDPAVRAELLELLGVDNTEQRRQRRQEEVRGELASIELRWKLAEEEPWI
jgi:cytochrome P450